MCRSYIIICRKSNLRSFGICRKNNLRTFGTNVAKNLRTSSGKFLRIKFCRPESLLFRPLGQGGQGGLVIVVEVVGMVGVSEQIKTH